MADMTTPAMLTRDTGVSRQGELLITPWLHAKERVRQLTAQLERARADEKLAASAVTVWLMPTDAKVGEKIAVWYLDGLIQVEIFPAPTPPALTIRTRGRKMDLAAAEASRP